MRSDHSMSWWKGRCAHERNHSCVLLKLTTGTKTGEKVMGPRQKHVYWRRGSVEVRTWQLKMFHRYEPMPVFVCTAERKLFGPGGLTIDR